MSLGVDEQTIFEAAPYEPIEPLGEGGQATTYLVRKGESGPKLVLKAIPVHRLDSMRALDAFSHEIEVLSQLDHPRIPAYVDSHLPTGESDETAVYLVQAYVEGPTLLELIEEGRRWSEEELRSMTETLLDVLVYLQDREPPVVHRDIKPANVVCPPDAEVALVDFGAVDWFEPGDLGGETMVGTTGYMAPEQFTGRAVPASDLYSLGATLVHAASQRHPSDIPREEMRLQFREYVDLSEPFESFLEVLLEPVVEDRFSDAREARDYLDRLSEVEHIEPGDEQVLMQRRGPRETDVDIYRTPSSLEVEIPGELRPTYLGIHVLAGVILSLVFSLLFYTTTSFEFYSFCNFWMLYVPIVLGAYHESRRGVGYRLRIEDGGYTLKRCGLLWTSTRTGDLEHFMELTEGEGWFVPGQHSVHRALQWKEATPEMFGSRSETFEICRYVSAEEREWIRDEIEGFLDA